MKEHGEKKYQKKVHIHISKHTHTHTHTQTGTNQSRRDTAALVNILSILLARDAHFGSGGHGWCEEQGRRVERNAETECADVAVVGLALYYHVWYNRSWRHGFIIYAN